MRCLVCITALIVCWMCVIQANKGPKKSALAKKAEQKKKDRRNAVEHQDISEVPREVRRKKLKEGDDMSNETEPLTPTDKEHDLNAEENPLWGSLKFLADDQKPPRMKSTPADPGLNNETFVTITNYVDKFSVLYFHVEGCDYCSHLNPVWDLLSENFNQNESSAVLGNVDCGSFDGSPICEMLKVGTWPIIRYYSPETGYYGRKYGGNKDYDALFNFINDKVFSRVELHPHWDGPPTKKVMDADEKQAEDDINWTQVWQDEGIYKTCDIQRKSGCSENEEDFLDKLDGKSSDWLEKLLQKMQVGYERIKDKTREAADTYLDDLDKLVETHDTLKARRKKADTVSKSMRYKLAILDQLRGSKTEM
eukprot:gnl/TRDRNA2_/TRDRNA2_80928_c0_seq1.p1 gnl/TRDRNA2_/TRDRNA2_80928_c0~~gnl/TRDRNA2_/TRDRNA2_80928_c0_seq1.p1  ORF type:complete len:365 (+),score=88.65 gnl/TRDRNA2_/TRDRNA2_80928_c0_seq1:67-1161(+)